MAEALFIDDDYIKTHSPLGKSIDVDTIYPFVSSAQDIYIQDILGTPLYNSLVSKVVNSTTFTSIEWGVVELLSKSLVYWTVYLALPHVMIKIRNAGVVKGQSDGTTISDLSEMKYIREEMKNLAEFWNQRLVNYLCNNSKDLPLYTATSDDLTPNTKQYFSDIYIEDSVYRSLTDVELSIIKKYLS